MTDTNLEVLARLEARYQQLFTLSDTLDTKASIALVLITFLAQQTGTFLARPQLPLQLYVLQIAAAFALLFGGLTAFACLWPRDHETETAEQLDEWLQQLRAYYKDADNPAQAVDKAFQAGRIQRLKERISSTKKIDDDKSAFVY